MKQSGGKKTWGILGILICLGAMIASVVDICSAVEFMDAHPELF